MAKTRRSWNSEETPQQKPYRPGAATVVFSKIDTYGEISNLVSEGDVSLDRHGL